MEKRKYIGNIKLLTKNIIEELNSKEDTMEIGKVDLDNMWEELNYEVGDGNLLKHWSYSKDDKNKIVTLNYHTGYEVDVIVYSRYKIGDEVYKTKLSNYPTSGSTTVQSPYMFISNATYVNTNNNDYIKTIKFNKGIDMTGVTNMTEAFYGMDSLEKLDLTGLDIRNVSILTNFFLGSKKLKEILVSRELWVIKSGANVSNMFVGCGTNHVTYVD